MKRRLRQYGRLPHDPRNFREVVEADLRRAARLIVKIQDEIDPQFRIATPEGIIRSLQRWPPDVYGRKVILRNLSLFMAWKQSLGFTLASELTEPDAVYCVGHNDEGTLCLSCWSPARAEALAANNFGKIEWLSEGSIDPLLLDLLPRGARDITTRVGCDA